MISLVLLGEAFNRLKATLICREKQSVNWRDQSGLTRLGDGREIIIIGIIIIINSTCPFEDDLLEMRDV